MSKSRKLLHEINIRKFPAVADATGKATDAKDSEDANLSIDNYCKLLSAKLGGTGAGTIIKTTREYQVRRIAINKGVNKGQYLYISIGISYDRTRIKNKISYNVEGYAISDSSSALPISKNKLNNGLVLEPIPSFYEKNNSDVALRTGQSLGSTNQWLTAILGAPAAEKLAALKNAALAKSLAYSSVPKKIPTPKTSKKATADAEQDTDKAVKDTESGANRTYDSSISNSIKQFGVHNPKNLYAVPTTSGSKFEKLLKALLNDMLNKQEGHLGRSPIILTGDPGGGKTSIIRALGVITGLPTVIIEAPHIIEEQIMKIPYTVIANTGLEKKDSVSDYMTGTELSIKFAKSHLGEIIRTQRKAIDSAWEHRYMRDSQLSRIITPYLADINKIRSTYQCILFIDEYYRTGSVKMQNMLREIINGHIGDVKLDIKKVYLVTASNLGSSDEGIDDIPMNNSSYPLQMNTFDKSDFLSFMKAKYVDEVNMLAADFPNGTESLSIALKDPRQTKLKQFLGKPQEELITPEEKEYIEKTISRTLKRPKISPEVFGAFRNVMEDEDLGNVDTNSDETVRLSGRRLEQIMMFVSVIIDKMEKMSGDDRKKAAEGLMSFINTNLRNYKPETFAPSRVNQKMLDKYSGVISDIIKSKFGINVSQKDILPASDWLDELDQQIQASIALGPDRKNIPVISGPPGIGKTQLIGKKALRLKMGYVSIPCTGLKIEDIIGIPAADAENEQIDFSIPPLLATIELRKKEWISEFGEPEGQGAYKWVIFFDEFNRVQTIKVFNVLRKLILERKFAMEKLTKKKNPLTGSYEIVAANEVTLPDDMLVVGAINPLDISDATIPLTSHMRDVLDVIDAEGKWQEWYTVYVSPGESSSCVEATLAGTGVNLKQTMVDAYKALVNLQVGEESLIDSNSKPIEGDQKYFHLRYSEGRGIYVPPRDLDNLMSAAALDAMREMQRTYGLTPEMDVFGDGVVNWLVEILQDEFITKYKQLLDSLALTNPDFAPLVGDTIAKADETIHGLDFSSNWEVFHRSEEVAKNVDKGSEEAKDILDNKDNDYSEFN